MAWFKKGESKEGLPELPPLSLPSPMGMGEKEEEEKIPVLPSFPSSSTGEKISREAVKQLIEEQEEGEMEEKPMFPSIKEMPQMSMMSERQTEKGPIFIQIERYNEVLKDLDEAKSKVNKIHEILKDVKKFKEEEENEIIEWETELMKIKEDLNRIDQTIFKKLK